MSPRVYSQKINLPVPTTRGPRLITLRLPAIEAYQSLYYLKTLLVDQEKVALVEAANVDAMVRRQLKDDMPGYLLKATTQAVSQVIAQEVAYHAAKSSQNNNNRNQQANAEMIGQLAALAAGVVMSAGDVDVRAWTTLPGTIYLGRQHFDKGERRITIPTPTGIVNAKISLRSDYELVYVRILGNGAIVLAQAPLESVPGYLKPPQPIASEKSAASTQPQQDCPTGKDSLGWETLKGFWNSATREDKACE